MTKAKALRNYFKAVYGLDLEGMSEVETLRAFFRANGIDSSGSTVSAVLQNAVNAGFQPSGGGGGSSSSKSDVNFYDYDGTITNSYTKDEFLALSALPENPSHDGLTAQGWNYSLADAQAHVTKYGKLNVGQMYTTTSGATEIDIELTEGRITPTLGICPNGTVEIDWGDGSTDTVSGTSLTALKNTQHTYPAPGKYTIKLTGTFGIVGNNTYGSRLLWDQKTSDSSTNRTYQNAVKAIRIGNGVMSIGNYAFNSCYSLSSVTIPDSVTSGIKNDAFRNCYSLSSVTIPEGVTIIEYNTFYNCYSLSSVTIPDSVTSIGSSAFYYCYSLSSITIPEGITIIGSSAFYYCYSLSSVTIPDSVTSIDDSAFRNCYSLSAVTIPEGETSIKGNTFYNCYSLSSVTIPEGVTSIGDSAFRSCYSMAEYHLEPTTPPSIYGNTFNGIPSDCIIYVPTGSLSAYQSASNWSTYASRMVGE